MLRTLASEWAYSEGFLDTMRDLHAQDWWLRVEEFGSPPAIGQVAWSNQEDLRSSQAEEAGQLVAEVIASGSPYTEIVTADFTRTNAVLADAYGLEFDPSGPEWQRSSYLDGRPAAGILSTNGLWLRHFAGEANARVRLAVVSADGGPPTWMDLGDERDIYLARVQWMPDGSLWVQRQNREQTQLDLLRFDPETGTSTTILSEKTDVWINLHNMLRAIEKGPLAGKFIWASERTGFQHLYLYGADGALERPLTRGEWMVERIVAVDEEGQRLFFEGTLDGPTERHLYELDLAGGEVELV